MIGIRATHGCHFARCKYTCPSSSSCPNDRYTRQISDLALSQIACSRRSSSSPSTSMPFSNCFLGVGCTTIFANVPAECALEACAGFTTKVESTICRQNLATRVSHPTYL